MPTRGPRRDHAVQPTQAESLSSLFGKDAPSIVAGVIHDVVAGQRVYKVGIAGQIVPCVDVAVDAGMHPLGPLKIHVYQPGTHVLVLFASGRRYGYIVGAMPFLIGSAKMNLPVPIAPFTGADSANDLVHYYPLLMAFAGGVLDYNSGRPLDAIPGSDAGVINELGVGYGVSRFFSWLKSSEFSGVWCHYLDMLVRICAYNYELRHSGGEKWIKNDEGEIDGFEWMTPFPWEALGLLDPSGAAITESDKGGWYSPGVKENRFTLADPNLQGIGRHFHWRGYLGDLDHEMIVVPEQGKVPTLETLRNPSNYTGVLSLQKFVDGTYAVRSARQIMIEKYSVIPVPKQCAMPEEAKGDGDTSEDYKAAGKTGDGEEHTKKPWEFNQEDAPATWLCELADYHSYMFNYYGFVPIIRHTKDWYLPEASEAGIGQVGSGADPAVYVPEALGSKFAFPPPKTVTLKVDHRTDAVKYYLSRSFINLMPDGSVILGDGYGSSIMMSQGHIFLDAAGDIFLKPGRNLVAMAGSDVAVKAGKSLDLSAALKDVRIKAEKNLHMLAGNSGEGGMLLESRATSETFVFKDKVGEDVKSSGIVLQAKTSSILGYAKDVYMRTEPSGKLTLDAAGGKGQRVDIGNQIVRIGMQFADFAGEELEDGEFTTESVSTNLFNKNVQVFGADGVSFFQSGMVVMANTDKDTQLLLDGTIQCGGSILAEGQLQLGGSAAIFGSCVVKGVQIASAHANRSGSVARIKEAPLKDEDPPEIKDSMEKVAVQGDELEETFIETVPEPLQEKYYADKDKVGHEEFREVIGFSMRNDVQYGVQEMALPEAIYQQQYRVAGSGVVYVEPEVESPDGEITLPYPGRKAWQEDKSFRMCDPSLFDSDTGRAKDRDAGGYTSAKNDSGVKKEVLKGNYLVTKQE